jgi:hypothetical protein
MKVIGIFPLPDLRFCGEGSVVQIPFVMLSWEAGAHFQELLQNLFIFCSPSLAVKAALMEWKEGLLPPTSCLFSTQFH